MTIEKRMSVLSADTLRTYSVRVDDIEHREFNVEVTYARPSCRDYWIRNDLSFG